ncbi:MAG: FecR family protein, partial [Verrucomicrobiota bacterium]|nr:FecR family protein [Verrucomicrobiota bacterium]
MLAVGLFVSSHRVGRPAPGAAAISRVQRPASGVAVVSQVQGSATLRNAAGAAIPAAIGAAIRSGESVSVPAGSRAQIRLADRTAIDINENTVIVVAPDARCAVVLRQGALYCAVAPRKPGDLPFVVRTAAGHAVSALGTEFEVFSDGSRAILNVEQGRLRMETPAGSAEAGSLQRLEAVGATLLPARNITLHEVAPWKFKPDAFLVPMKGLRLWLSADVGVSKDNANQVSIWADRSGGGRDAVQPNASTRPLYDAAGLNGKPAIRFDGSDDLMRGNIGPIAAPLTVVAVGRFAQLSQPANDYDYLFHLGAMGAWGSGQEVSISRRAGDNRYYNVYNNSVHQFGPPLPGRE